MAVDKACIHYQVNNRAADFNCDLQFGHSSSMAHRSRDGTRWRAPGEKRGKLRPHGIPKHIRGKTK